VTSALYAVFSQEALLSTEIVLKEIQSTYPLSVTMKERVAGRREWAGQWAVPAN
jgi:hypothetical protein